MGRYDVLGGQAAKAATVLPNHYILDLPPSESGQRLIYARCFPIAPSLEDQPESSADAQRRASIAARAAREAEVLEQAWRKINSGDTDRDAPAQSGSGAGFPIRELLSRGPCAVVIPESAKRPAALWTFSFSADEPLDIEGLKEATDESQVFSPLDVIACPVHGNSPTCLGLPQPSQLYEACRPQIAKSSARLQSVWRYFSYAIVERLAWTHGKRLCMMPSSSSSRPSAEPHVRVTLAVRDAGSLLLTVLPRRQSHSPRQTMNPVNSVARAVTLDPLDLPALRLGPFSPDSAQLVNLESAFRNALGPGWRDGRQKRRYQTVLDGGQWSDWCILWVPVEPLASRPTSPADGAGSSRGQNSKPQGVLTIWPSHLVSPIGSRSSGHSSSLRSSTKRKAEASAIYTAPEAQDLLKTAAGLFDFLSTYKEPDPPGEADGDEGGDAVQEATQGSGYAESGTADGLTPRTATREDGTSARALGTGADNNIEDGGSDMDDLFSERGGSPPPASVQGETARPAEDLDVDLFPSAMADGQTEREDLDDLFGGSEHDTRESDGRQDGTATRVEPPAPVELDKDEEMASPSPHRYQEPPSRAESGFQFENNFVTEDDFAFFDSPGDADATPKPTAMEPVAEDPVAEEATVEAIPEAGNAEPSMPQQVVPASDPIMGEDQDKRLAEIAIAGPGIALDAENRSPQKEAGLAITTQEQVKLDDKGPTKATERQSRLMTPESPVNEPRVLPEAIPLPPSPSPPGEIIPAPFEALDLPSGAGTSSKTTGSLPSLAYRFPTPALTPEELRVDLVERLRPAAAKKARFDYASAWHEADDDASDLDQIPDEYDDTEDGYTAPPTPDSQMDGEWYSIFGARPSPAVLADGSQAVATGTAGRRDASQEGQLEWNDSPCVAAEWLWLRSSSAAVEDVARPFDPSWLDGKLDASSLLAGLQGTAQVAVKRDLSVLDLLDVDRFAKEIVTNRQFRHVLAGGSGADVPGDPSMLALLPPSGTILRDMASEPAPTQNSASWQLQPCNVHAGYDGRIMSLGMAGLRFWPQLGLSPLGGQKNIDVTVICGVEPAAQRAARQLAGRFASSYEALRLGSCGEPVITAVQPQNVGSAVQAMSYPPDIEDSRSVVFILFNQSSAIVSSSALEICFAPRKIPATTVFHVLATTSIQDKHMSAIAFDVYNRLCKRIERVDFYGAPVEPDSDLWMDFPAFTLAAGPSDPPPKLNFELSWPVRSYDLLNKWRMVHGAYAWDSTTGVVVAFAIDAEGENWRVGTWRFDPAAPSDAKGAVSKLKEVWNFFVRVATLSAIEWRLSICKLGMMEPGEIVAWRDLLPVQTTQGVTLLMMDPPDLSHHHVPRPRPPIAAFSPAVLFDPQTRLIDETLLGRACFFAYRFPVNISPSGPAEDMQQTEVIPPASFLLNVATPGQSTGDFSSSVYHVMATYAAPGKEDEDLLQLLAKQYYRLLCLGRLRFGFDTADLPVHLEAVRAVMAGINEICPIGEI